MRVSVLLSLVLVLAVSPQAMAVNSSAGATGYNFLKIGVGARPAAMGGAFVAIPADPEAASWNPAGISGISRRTGVLALNNYLVDTQVGSASIAMPGRGRTWALGVTYVSYGDMAHTNESGEVLGTFGAADMAASLTLAQPIWRDWLVGGVSLKAVYSSIDDYSSDAYMADVGALIHTPLEGLTLGASLSNVGAVRSGFAGDHKDSLPVNIRLGVSHRPAHMPIPMVLAADVNLPNDDDAFLALGAEIQLPGGLYLRPGYSTKQTGFQGNDALGFSGGLGLTAKSYRLDYAYSSYADLGDVHRFAISGQF